MWQCKIENLSVKKDLSLKIKMTKYFRMRTMKSLCKLQKSEQVSKICEKYETWK